MNDSVYCITNKPLADRPISPLLCGHFIELGYGLQVEGMLAEMLFNRSFERFSDYRPVNKDWYDLYYEPGCPEKGYETDWSRFDWYHSGYEHNVWFAAPSSYKDTPSVIVDGATFVVTTSDATDVRLTQVDGGLHGKACLLVENGETERWCGVAQGGKLLKQGERYLFSGLIRNVENAETARVALYPEGDWDNPVAIIELSGLGSGFALHTTELLCGYTGRATFALLLPPGGKAELDGFSLKPENNWHGWRPEVVEAAKALAPKVIRWPGGCFASFYDWMDGIGSQQQRQPRPSYFWGGLNANDAGSMELACLSEATGAQQMVCVNLFHPLKERYDYYFDAHHYGEMTELFPQFTSLEKGAEHAANWVAYLNAGCTHPMGALRAQHGHPKPFGVKYFELDNETDRWFKPLEYANACVVYSRAMKAIDPEICIGMQSYGYDHDSANLPAMLGVAGGDIDFLADRGHSEENTNAKLALIRAHNSAHQTCIKYCNTEWLPYDLFHFKMDSFNRIEGNKSFLFSKWRYAMNIFRQIMMWQRKGDDVLFVNFNNFANTHAQNVLDTPKEGVYLSASGKAMQLLAHSPASRVLRIENYEPDMLKPVQFQAALDESGTKLVLYMLNMEDDVRELRVNWVDTGLATTREIRQTLLAESLTSMNTLQHPDEIRHIRQQAAISGNEAIYSLAPYSFTEIILC